MQSLVVSLRKIAQEEWENTAKREANIRVAKAFAVFFGSIVVRLTHVHPNIMRTVDAPAINTP